MKKILKIKIFTVLIFLCGIAILIYPVISKIISNFNQTVAISNYNEIVMKMTQEEIENSQKIAMEFNNELYENNTFDASLTEVAVSSINIVENEVLAYIIIPKINVELPIYEGSSSSILSIGIGHLSNTSLPIGGKNNHCVLVRSYRTYKFSNVR